MVFLEKLEKKKTLMFTKTHNLNNEKTKTRTYLKDEKNYENKTLKCNILMLFFHETKNKTRKTKTRKVKIKTRQQGKKKNWERERESVWQREVKETQENERETRKGDTEKWTKITFFQGEKQCFCKKTQKNQKNKKGWRPTAQKHTCNAALAPQSQEECEQKRKTPKEKEGDVKRTTWGLRKRGRKKNRKRRKTPPHRSREDIFGNDPKSEKKNDTAAHPPRAKFARAADTLRKMAFSKRARFCSPKGFLPWKSNFDKVSNIEPYKIVTRTKNYPQDGSTKSCHVDTPKGLEDVESRNIAPKPLVL